MYLMICYQVRHEALEPIGRNMGFLYLIIYYQELVGVIKIIERNIGFIGLVYVTM